MYHIEFLSNFIHGILDIFSSFTGSIKEIFGAKVDKPIETPSRSSRLDRIQSKAEGISKGDGESPGIVERFTGSRQPEQVEEDTPIYKNKYVILAGLLILSGLT